jgi:hypothetical protein
MTRSALVRLLVGLVLQGVLIGMHLSSFLYRRGAFAADATPLDLTLGYTMVVGALALSVIIGRDIVRRTAGTAPSRAHVA